MSRRPRLRMTDKDAMRSLRSNPDPCIDPRCDGRIVQMGIGPGYRECYECGKKWAFIDGKGRTISKKEYDEFGARQRNRQSVDQSSGWLEGADAMGTKTAAKKVAKKAVKKETKKQSVGKDDPAVYALTNAPRYTAFLVVTTKDDDETIRKIVAKKFPDATPHLQRTIYVTDIRDQLAAKSGRWTWLMPLVGTSKATAKPAKKSDATMVTKVKKSKKK